ncbi:hypothetical protein D0B54_17360 [Solimonas sp. K1W22B-7]|uniref:DUF4870 family protein n=1 Tax=Solimonas sp. K1W22B-7 TaxID=2303331 RepID=UPI000E33191D|nr:hypothetical protein [Solimonas sp. K1W22B-7]AXQ30331.1 hypothetical protein D0B54_17360 [Solimonas sp. K1W22B-7]
MNQPPIGSSPEAERNTLLIAYVLHIIAPFTFWTAAIAGVIIDHIKINETSSEFIRSHHRWLIHTFWWGLLWLVIASVLVWFLVGFVIYAVVAIWWLYRVVRGGLSFMENRPIVM